MISGMDTLSPEELHALKILAKRAEKVRGLLKPGKVSLDFGVHITGDLIIGADGQLSSLTKPSSIDLVAALLSQFGPRKRVAIADQLVERGLRAMTQDPEQTTGLAESIINALTTHALVDRRGNVTGQFDLKHVKVKG